MDQLYNVVIEYHRLKYLITDAASYMRSAGVNLKTLRSHLLHVTCAAHGIQRVIEEVRSNKTLADQFVSNIKKDFVKCFRRKRLFKGITELPLPPEPIVLRWNTWLECVFYYRQHFEMLSNFICNNLDKTESRAIEILQDSVNNPPLKKVNWHIYRVNFQKSLAYLTLNSRSAIFDAPIIS